MITSEPAAPPRDSEQPSDLSQPSGLPESAARESWRSEELLGDRTEVQILHNNEVYRLRRTRQGKLILHK